MTTYYCPTYSCAGREPLEEYATFAGDATWHCPACGRSWKKDGLEECDLVGLKMSDVKPTKFRVKVAIGNDALRSDTFGKAENLAIGYEAGYMQDLGRELEQQTDETNHWRDMANELLKERDAALERVKELEARVPIDEVCVTIDPKCDGAIMDQMNIVVRRRNKGEAIIEVGKDQGDNNFECTVSNCNFDVADAYPAFIHQNTTDPPCPQCHANRCIGCQVAELPSSKAKSMAIVLLDELKNQDLPVPLWVNEIEWPLWVNEIECDTVLEWEDHTMVSFVSDGRVYLNGTGELGSDSWLGDVLGALAARETVSVSDNERSGQPTSRNRGDLIPDWNNEPVHGHERRREKHLREPAGFGFNRWTNERER